MAPLQVCNVHTLALSARLYRFVGFFYFLRMLSAAKVFLTGSAVNYLLISLCYYTYSFVPKWLGLETASLIIMSTRSSVFLSKYILETPLSFNTRVSSLRLECFFLSFPIPAVAGTACDLPFCRPPSPQLCVYICIFQYDYQFIIIMATMFETHEKRVLVGWTRKEKACVGIIAKLRGLRPKN